MKEVELLLGDLDEILNPSDEVSRAILLKHFLFHAASKISPLNPLYPLAQEILDRLEKVEDEDLEEPDVRVIFEAQPPIIMPEN